MSMNSVIANLPSWLQAFAAIVALFIAVWGTLRADRSARRQAHLRARGIATAILPDIAEMASDFSTARIPLMTAALSGPDAAIAAFHAARVEIPPLLMRNVDNLYLLGEPAGPTCLRLVSTMQKYNNALRSYAALGDDRQAIWSIIMGSIDKQTKTIEPLLAQAQQHVAKLLGSTADHPLADE
jgi:hypothetical protein